MTVLKIDTPVDEFTAQSAEKEAIATSQPFTKEEGVDGPLLLTLLMGNNNNNATAQAASGNPVSDTLNPDYYALELSSTVNDDEGDIDNDLSTVDGQDGPLLFALMLNNQNNNNVHPNQNPNQKENNEISDTLDPRSVALELKFPVSNDADINDISVETSGEDGPLLFALLLNNQNNNNNPNQIPDPKENSAISDTLDPRGVALELRPPVGNNTDINDASIETSGEDGSLLSASNNTGQFVSEGGDGPLLLTMLLANENQNNGNKATEAMNKAIADTLDPSDTITEAISNVLESKPHLLELHPSKDTIAEAIPDVMEMKSQLLELHPSKDTITEAIPDVMEMKTQLLELHSPGNDEANSIPVMLKVNSQAQKAQILAMLQGRSIPVAITSNGTKGSFANGTLDRAQVTAANLQSTPHVALNEAKNGNLSDEQLQFWRENGYLVIPDTLPEGQKDHLLKTVHEAAQVLAGGGERVQKHAYFAGQKSYVSPVGRALATLSEHGFNPDVEPLKRIQRIGCGIHRVMPPFRKAILSPFHSTLARSLGYKDPCIYQSLIIVKAAEVGARVIPHQDGCSGFTNPSSCTTFWYALEDCSTENGCLAVAPGSHRVEPITRRCITNGNGQPVFTDLEKPVYADIEGVDDSTLPKKNEKGEFEYKKLEVKAGTLILMHGNLMHKSEANRSSKSRVAFNFGVVEGEHGWLEDNYLQPYEGATEFEKL
ncbi:uncharacterized protein EAE98_001364 [Botrytis deweyae]|uniref:Fe2OG dioxygenase domain-containing protein n=1 Tax=Botrytis deweyae TaxID=2478750 RepID=A0ABQ7J1B1_9HELO|nr:uncharacterized protein EAE98_001364 [Botrytis deweyae]KAF7939028.1 hypothetical protein EAE98_001364 [Botrytis deweyae]